MRSFHQKSEIFNYSCEVGGVCECRRVILRSQRGPAVRKQSSQEIEVKSGHRGREGLPPVLRNTHAGEWSVIGVQQVQPSLL